MARILTLMLALLILMPQAAYAAVTTGSSLDITLSGQNPYPVSPGNTVTIEVAVQNSGNDDAMGRTVEIMSSSPFSLLPGQDRIKAISKIPAMDSYFITYRLLVDDSTPTGSYPLDFKIYPTGQPDGYFEHEVDVDVEGMPNLLVSSIRTVPGVLEPGVAARLVVEVMNIGTGKAGDVQLSIAPGSADIKAVLSQGSVYLGSIMPGANRTGELGISIETGAEEMTYDATLTTQYKNENGSSDSKGFTIGLPVRGSISLEIIKMEPNYERQTLRVEIANKGTTEAKSLEAKLFIGDALTGIDYVSSLKANKKTTLEFPLALKGQGKLQLNYIGPGVETSSDSKDISLDFAPPSSGDGTTTLITIIVIALIAYFLYRKFFRKKHRKE